MKEGTRTIKAATRGLPKTRSVGLALALGTACISGVAIFVNTYYVVQSPDATVYTTAKNGVAAALLLAWLMATNRVPLKAPALARWKGLALLGLIGGGIAFVLFFEGLARTGEDSAPTAGFVHKTMVLWVAVLALPLLREKLNAFHILAIALLLIGQGVVADIGGASLGIGVLMIFGATLLWAVEFVIAKRLLDSLPSSVVGAARLGIGVVFLLLFVLVTGRGGALMSLTGEQWTWALITGGILAAFVATWFAALARAQAVDVTAVLVLGQIVTTILATGIKGVPVATNVTYGLLLIGLGVTTVTVAMLRPQREPITT